jgi:hypothetical protein
MKPKTKIARERAAVKRLAEMMYESLSKLPESEHQVRMASIQTLSQGLKLGSTRAKMQL